MQNLNLLKFYKIRQIGSESRETILKRIHAGLDTDPDPKHCIWAKVWKIKA